MDSPKRYQKDTNVSFLKVSIVIFALFAFMGRARSEKAEGGV